ncbi:HAD-superfamily hydrolase [Alcanivorax hongdengensis A-11-3]|uniref:Phospholysine phosphohistidine inorganic pyrophosphate phosphatase n=1 Tax=Alcanivorax hongdengensis A-11-3 TaxID=1177179 RepID=L0WCS6_9GAMM|nr:TIGR01458 family HAD-type hydrolase [Alcanivorax hongdengensis]EKF74809.1 HAD-superfamily hydrolase [Alcanivorax hongdengensis A-11-3]
MHLKAVCLDLSGVLYQGPRLLPDARESIAQLRRAGLPLRFVTNTSQRSRHQILVDLETLGLAVEPEELFTAPQAAHQWLKQHGYRPLCLIHPNLKKEFSGLPQQAPNAVLMGDAGKGFTYAHLDQAFRLLHDGAPLVAMGDNRYYQLDDGLHLDAGPFVRALEYAADCQAIITGKPSATFFQQVITSLECDAGEVLMVGDDAASDVQGALNAGLQGALVKTGKYRPGDETRIDGHYWLEDGIAAVVRRVLA